MLEYVALIIMLCVGLILFYAIIAIHDIPYEIAKRRGHPHLEAIHYAGWISMFTLHTIWPFLWIWATIYHADRGYGFSGTGRDIGKLREKLGLIEQRIAALETAKSRPVVASSETAGAPKSTVPPDVSETDKK